MKKNIQDKYKSLSVFLAGLEVCRLVLVPSNINENYVPMALSLIPPLHQISTIALQSYGQSQGHAAASVGVLMVIQCAKLMLTLLDVSLPHLKRHLPYIVTCFRTLLKSLSHYPAWADDRATAYDITSNMMLLFTRLRTVFKKNLEQDVGAIVLDYIELCENATHGKSVNTALTLLQPGIIGMLKLCSNDTMYAIRMQAITFGKFTWDQIHATMQELATNKGKW